MGKMIERKTVVTLGEKVTKVKIIDDGTAVEITSIFDCSKDQEAMKREEIKGTNEYLKKYFPIVRASRLTLSDGLLQYKPETENQKDFKEMLISAIKSGLKDFRAPIMDPSFDEDEYIIYKQNEEPAVGKSAIEWKELAREFLPEKNSRLGSSNERIAFLAFQIRYLVKKKRYTMKDAWKAVCDQSKDLGNYWDSQDGARSGFEHTGLRNIGEWCDLGNTYKITIDEESGDFMQTGGDYTSCGDEDPLSAVYLVGNPSEKLDSSTGWIVMDV